MTTGARIEPKKERSRVTLPQRTTITHAMAWFGIIVMSCWLILDWITGNIRSARLDLILLSALAVVPVLLRCGYERQARLALLLIANIVVFAGSIFYDPNSGGSLPFFVLVCLPWVLFEPEERIATLVSFLVPAALYTICESPLRRYIEPSQPIPSASWFFAANAASTFAGCFLAIHYFTSSRRQQEQRRFQRMVESNLFGMAVGRENGTIYYANDTLLKMLGFTRQEFNEGKMNLVALTPPEHRPITIEKFKEVSRSGLSTAFEKEYWHKDGHRVPVLLGLGALENDGPDSRVAFFFDLTETRKQQALLEKSQQAVQAWDEFSSVAAHELKNPIGILSLQLEMLKKIWAQKPSNEKLVGELIEGGERSARRLKQLTEQLMDFARIRTGNLHLNPTTADLQQIIESVISGFDTMGISKPGQIRFIPNGLMLGHWDAVRLDQVVTNVVSNAIKYGDGKPIEISANSALRDGWVIMSVKDQGVGIAPEMQARIFEKFERVEDVKRSVTGLGLGLYIVRNIIESHHGRILLNSSPGQGSTFTFELPISPPYAKF